jgi:hypothetical protein
MKRREQDKVEQTRPRLGASLVTTTLGHHLTRGGAAEIFFDELDR